MEHPFFIFWIKIFKKIIITFTSVKVWGLVGFPTLATILLFKEKINSEDFTSIVTTTIVTIYAIREAWKISNLSSVSNLVTKVKEKISGK